MSLRFLHSSQTPQHFGAARAGFGLIELMVSISIMLIVSAIILARQSSFNGAVLLRSQTYEIALAARELQLNAVSATGEGGDFRSLYGIHFSKSADNTFRIFRDADDDGYHDSDEEFGLQGSIDNRFYIKEIRADGISRSALSIVFERPNFDARFFTGSGTELDAAVAQIVIGKRDNPDGGDSGSQRTLNITATGQISVE